MIIDEYRLMAADSYHLQFTEVEIFGFLPSREIIYKGVGCISRDSDSRISIMVMTSLNTTFEQERAEATRKLRKGQVISHQLTCMMDAKDQLGRWWRDCEIFITKITNNGSETTIIAELDKFVLRLPKSTAGYTSRNNTEIIAIHNGHLPFKSIQTAKNSHSANLSFSIPGITVEITRDIPCTKITIIHDDAIDLDQIKILLEAISICSGRLITPLLIGRHENEHYHLELLQGASKNRPPHGKIGAPLILRSPAHAQSVCRPGT